MTFHVFRGTKRTHVVGDMRRLSHSGRHMWWPRVTFLISCSWAPEKLLLPYEKWFLIIAFERPEPKTISRVPSLRKLTLGIVLTVEVRHNGCTAYVVLCFWILRAGNIARVRMEKGYMTVQLSVWQAVWVRVPESHLMPGRFLLKGRTHIETRD